MSEKLPNQNESLSERDFVLFLAGKDRKSHQEFALVNDNNSPLEELVHPLTYSMDIKHHPDMQAVPASIKFSRDFEKLYNELRK